MKKFAGLMCGYCNKSGWTSPEQLMAEGPVAWQVKESDDVYSFGVVLWELMTEQVPFPDLPPEDLRHVVAEQNNRPELTSDINEVLTKLIKSCWNISPAKRPSFKLIYSTLCLVPIKAR
jgi:serine/threonine protein kinase